MLFTAAFHRNRETGIRTVEDFLYDIVLSIGLNKLKTTTALEAGRRPGIGYARTCGNIPKSEIWE